MKVLFILATHGNEGFSIPVFQKLEKALPKDIYNYEWIIGNPKALDKKVRFIDADLNRVAPGKRDSKKYEEARAAEIIEIAKSFDAVVDIHGAISNCGICSIISLPTIENLFLASQFECQNNVIWNSKSSKAHGPINQHVGKPAFELECGPKDDQDIADKLYQIISDFLENKQSTIFVANRLNWYTVIGKKDKNDFANNALSDFIPASNNQSIVPFLSKNSYPDGSFYILEKIDFTRLFQR